MSNDNNFNDINIDQEGLRDLLREIANWKGSRDSVKYDILMRKARMVLGENGGPMSLTMDSFNKKS